MCFISQYYDKLIINKYNNPLLLHAQQDALTRIKDKLISFI
jgi:hypothetical protein